MKSVKLKGAIKHDWALFRKVNWQYWINPVSEEELAPIPIADSKQRLIKQLKQSRTLHKQILGGVTDLSSQLSILEQLLCNQIVIMNSLTDDGDK